MNGIPTAFDQLRAIASLFNEYNSSKAVVQIPQIHRRNATFKIPASKMVQSINQITFIYISPDVTDESGNQQ